jgi:hypothetical protein
MRQDYDPFEGYLNAKELYQQSGLYPNDVTRLEAAQLLLPDTKDRRYRPKLAGWNKKLAYLVQEGWQLEEIQAWAKGRWKSENPRKWPHSNLKIDSPFSFLMVNVVHDD